MRVSLIQMDALQIDGGERPSDRRKVRLAVRTGAIPQDRYWLAHTRMATVAPAFRKKIYSSLEELQADLDAWISLNNHERTHQGKMCCGRTPMATFEDGKQICREKMIA